MHRSSGMRWDKGTHPAFGDFGTNFKSRWIGDAKANEIGRLPAFAVAVNPGNCSRTHAEARDACGQVPVVDYSWKLFYRRAPIGYISVEGARMAHDGI